MPTISLENTKNLYNVVTNKGMPNDQALRFCNPGDTGADKYKIFIEERLIGDKSIWDTITKEKTPTFVCNNKQITVTVKKESVNLKEERKLMSGYLVALRSRPRMDLSYYLGKFELVPRSLERTGGYSTVYQVHDETKSDNLETKEFLSSIETKNNLIVFLSKKVASVLSEMSICYVTV